MATLRSLFEGLMSGLGDNVGGVVVAKAGESRFSRLLAYLLNSKLGNGGAGYRSDGSGKLVDTVWCGCWYKSTLEKVGMFDVEWPNNQDAELNARLIAGGFTVYSHPGIRASLVVRSTFRGFLKQYFMYGRGRLKTIRRHPRSLKVRQLAPLVAVSGLFLCVVFAPIYSVLMLVVLSVLISLVFRYHEREFSKLPFFMQLLVFPLSVVMNVVWVFGLLFQLQLSVFNKRQSN